MRKGQVVIEYVGSDIDAGFALKTSYELGLVPKPASVRYRVVAELATVEKPDYMACNPLLNQFLALESGSNPDAIQQIDALAKKFQFGRTLVLRNPKLDGSAVHEFQPATTAAEDSGATIAYSFDELPDRQGVPYATVTIDITLDDTGFRESAATPANALTAATPFWPADDPRIVAAARRITAGRSTNDAKVTAILASLSPGRNLKYSGQTGSRWGTMKVFEQKFGHCWDFSDCFVTLARAAGVPSRQVAGWLYGSSGHVWAEYYREGKGWQQVDPTGGGKLQCGIYYIPYFTSEDGEMPILYVSMPKIEAVQSN
jgi:transglutaminase-like putative cysteine protease